MPRKKPPPDDKPLVLLHGEIRTPPLGEDARREAGYLLRKLQQGETLGMPHSKKMASIGPRVAELRINDEGNQWRIIYRVDPDMILVVDVFLKKTQKTPKIIIDACKKRLAALDAT